MSSALPPSAPLSSSSARESHNVAGVSLRKQQQAFLPAARAPTFAPTTDEVECRDLGQLTAEEWQAWRTIRRQNETFSLPFFAPEFSRAVHAARGDVQVAVIRRGSSVIGLLPFHRIGRVGYPVGRFFNDAHGILQAPETSLTWMDVLAKLSLRSFDAHALVGFDEGVIETCRLNSIGAYSAELGNESRGYLGKLEAQHATIKRQPQKTRKLTREVGEVRLEIDCRCPEILAKVVQWKRDQYVRTHILDLFSPPWTRDLVFKLHEKQRQGDSFRDADLSGLCSVLWAGEVPVAAHFGMIERGRLHYWFPAYDAKFAKYSPGTALFRHLVKVASDHCIHTIDMGYGEQPYKQKQTDVVSQVAAGCISRCRLHRSIRWLQNTASAIAKQTPMKSAVKRAVRAVMPDAGIGKLG